MVMIEESININTIEIIIENIMKNNNSKQSIVKLIIKPIKSIIPLQVKVEVVGFIVNVIN
jgi:hypothetical protein